MSKKEEKKNSKESVDDVKMTEKDADAAKTAGAEDDGTQAQKENTDAEIRRKRVNHPNRSLPME